MERCIICGTWVETDGEPHGDILCSQQCRDYNRHITEQETEMREAGCKLAAEEDPMNAAVGFSPPVVCSCRLCTS
jgi:hypothetical protein